LIPGTLVVENENKFTSKNESGGAMKKKQEKMERTIWSDTFILQKGQREHDASKL